MISRRHLNALLVSATLAGMAAAPSLARSPDPEGAARELETALESREREGHGLVVLYVDTPDRRVARSIGSLGVTLDGLQVAKLGRKQRYVILSVPVGTHSVGINQGGLAVVRRVIEVEPGSRHFMRYLRNVQATAERTFMDVQVANVTSLDTVDEYLARERIAAIHGVVNARGR